jgi:hypothetical protein
VLRFVSEPIRPVPGTFDTDAMARGEPGLPRRFVWRKAEYEVVRVLEQWKETGPCWTGGGEHYVRRHCYQIETTDGSTMRLYCQRKTSRGKPIRQRWWMFGVEGKDTEK